MFVTKGGEVRSKTLLPPAEWTELQLCRDVYHCLPSALASEDYDAIATHLELMGEEASWREKQQKGRR